MGRNQGEKRHLLRKCEVQCCEHIPISKAFCSSVSSLEFWAQEKQIEDFFLVFLLRQWSLVLFGSQSYWENDRHKERDFLPALPEWPQCLRLDRSKGQSQELYLFLPHGWQAPNSWAIICCLHRHNNRLLDWKWSSLDRIQSLCGCYNCKKQLNPL